ncbi:hypothetical protein HPB51_006480 [Rhipicephalus microplus]|uniref:Uncharacterized protein n=2 Tax=Rhipicephalus microplus TaxID=6941 RepID=A0A9J6E7G4_RHIMP|nr:hypothetical protein HPB51_006480 [Rhipicephalus microplus]
MEASPPSGVQSQPTAIVPSVTVGVSVPETETSTMPSFPHEEFSTHFPSGPSGIPSTEVPPISGITSQPTVIAPSVTVGVSVPEEEPGSSQTLPHAEITTPIPSGISGVPITEISPPLDVQSQPTAIVPSLSVGVSVPEGEAGSVPSFPVEEFSTPFPSGPSDIPTTETPPLSGVPSQLTAIVPSVTAGLSWPETEPGSSQTLPHGKVTAPFPLGPSGLPFTEAQLPSSSPAHPAGMVSSVSPGVSEPGTKPGGSHTLPYMPTTELSIPSGLQGQTTAIVPSLSIGVSVPETHTSSVPAFPHGELTSYPTGAPGQLTAVVPSVSVGVSTPESGANTRPSSSEEELTTISPSGPLVTSTEKPTPSEASLPSEASGEPSTVSPFASLGVSVPEGGTQPTLPAEEESGTKTPYFGVPSSAPFQPSIAAPSMSATVSVPQFAASSPSFTPVTGTLSSAMTVIPTSEVSLPRGVSGEPTAIVPSSSVGVFLSGPSLSPGEISSHFPPGGSAVSTTEVSLPFGVTSFQGVPVPSYSVGVSVPEVATSTAVPLTVETRTLPSGSIASETVPKTPAQMPSTFPHGTPVVMTTLPSVPMGPYVPRGTLPTSSVKVNVETETTPPSFASVELSTNVGFPSGLLPTSVVAVSEATVGVSVPSTFVPTVATPTTPSFHGTKVANTFTSTQVPHQTGPEEPISTTPSFITPETEDIWALLVIIRTDLKMYKVNATVLHTLLIKATMIGSHDAYTIILLALKDLKVTCKYLAPSERIKVAYEVAHYLKSHGTRIAHDVVVKAVGVFLCAVDHKDIITKLLSENTYMISISESVASELSCPDMEHLVHLLYADRNRTKIEESPCAGILCEEVPENVMDTIDMLVDRYFPQKAHEKKWLMLDIAKALNLQPEEDEEGDEMVYYKMGDYDVFLEELREPTISDEEKALLFGKFFAEVRKVAKAERKLRLDDLEEVWKMGGGKLPQPAVRSFIALLKLVHSKRISLKTEERIRLLKLALRCDGHECTKLSSSDIHNLIFALCNVGIRDGFGLPKELKSQVTKFILTLKDSYIDSISIRRWKRSSSLLKPRSHDYLSASSPSELRYLKDWLQKPMAIAQKQGLLKNTGRSNDDPSGSKGSALSQLYNAYVNEKRPDIKTVLAERLLDTYNDSFRHLGSEIEDTKKFVLTVVQQLPLTSSRHNDLVLGILEQCIRRGSPCLNISSSESIAPLKVILQNMSLKQSPNFVPNLIHQLFAAAKKARTHVDLSWLTNNGSARRTFQTRVPHLLETPSRAYRLS